MNVNMNTSVSLAQSAGGAVGLTVLKKALDIEAQNAMLLINILSQPPQQSAASSPPHLGQNINIFA